MGASMSMPRRAGKDGQSPAAGATRVKRPAEGPAPEPLLPRAPRPRGVRPSATLRAEAAAPQAGAAAQRAAGSRPSLVPAPGETAPLRWVAPPDGRTVQRLRQARPSGIPSTPGAAPSQAVADGLRGPGQPLAGPVRANMEARLGADLSDVRVHTDAAAHQAATAVSARAFTAGSHIAFQRCHYDPASAAGQHTLAHELTHVIQQRSGPVAGTDHGGLRVSDPADRFERAAEDSARRALSGPARFPAGGAAASGSPIRPGPVIQRYTNVGRGAALRRRSQTGVYLVVPREPTVWALNNTPVSAVLRPVTDQAAQARFPGYTPYEIGREVLEDCLHAAEEIINGVPGELKHGQLHSTIEVTRKRGPGTVTKDFGEDYDPNVDLAQRFAGPQDTLANPQVSEAFVIIATTPQGRMSPYHAAAVVARDGNDAVTLETWAGTGQGLPDADMYQVGDRNKSFHGRWSRRYFKRGTNPITVVIGPAGGALAQLPARKRLKRNPNV